MEEFKNFLKSRRIALIISALYVGLGTTAVCSVYGSDLLYGEWAGYVLLITAPVTFISFFYRFVDANIFPVLVIQFIMFIITFLILSLFIKKRNNAE